MVNDLYKRKVSEFIPEIRPAIMAQSHKPPMRHHLSESFNLVGLFDDKVRVTPLDAERTEITLPMRRPSL